MGGAAFVGDFTLKRAVFTAAIVLISSLVMPLQPIAAATSKECINFKILLKRDRAANAVSAELRLLRVAQKTFVTQLRDLLPRLTDEGAAVLEKAASDETAANLRFPAVTDSLVDREPYLAEDWAGVVIKDPAFSQMDEAKRKRLAGYLATRGKRWLTVEQATLIGRYLLANTSLPDNTHRTLATYFNNVVDSIVLKHILADLEGLPGPVQFIHYSVREAELDGLIANPSNSTAVVRWRPAVRMLLEEI